MEDLLNHYFPDGAPIIVQVAFKYGYGPALMELNKKVYLNHDLSFSSQIVEAIQALCLSSCKNKYCAVMHSRGLISQGFTLEDAKRLVELQRLPSSVEDRERWEDSLRRVATLFREPQAAPYLRNSLTETNSASEIEDIGGIIAFSWLHKFLLEFYSDEIRIEQEPILFETISCGSELIHFFSQYGDSSRPTFILCCMCKDIKSTDEWLPIEASASDLAPGPHVLPRHL